MRLKPEAIASIKQAVHEHDQNAQVYLFGSRVDDQKKGGDIDLLVLSKKITNEQVFSIKKKIFASLGEQKIDILIAHTEQDNAFVQLAYNTGVLL